MGLEWDLLNGVVNSRWWYTDMIAIDVERERPDGRLALRITKPAVPMSPPPQADPSIVGRIPAPVMPPLSHTEHVRICGLDRQSPRIWPRSAGTKIPR
jgi:hypothetical protein